MIGYFEKEGGKVDCPVMDIMGRKHEQINRRCFLVALKAISEARGRGAGILITVSWIEPAPLRAMLLCDKGV